MLPGTSAAIRDQLSRTLLMERIWLQQRRECLLGFGLRGNETHSRPSRRLAGGLRVHEIVLVSLHKWLDLPRRDQLGFVTECLQFSRKAIGACAGIHDQRASRDRADHFIMSPRSCGLCGVA